MFLVFPLFIVFFTEYVGSRDIGMVFDLVTRNAPSFLFAYFLVGMVFGVFFLLLGGFSFFITAILFSVLANISFYKNQILNDYLFPTDIFIFNGSYGTLTHFLSVEVMAVIFAMILCSVGVSFGYFHFFKGFKLSLRARVGALLVLLSVSSYVFANEDFRLNELKKITGFNIEDLNWRQKYNYEHNGFITAFFINLGNIYIPKPVDYSEENIEKILKSTENLVGQRTSNVKSDMKPNVIFILSEAFWDITKIPGISFEKDPLANFRRLQREGAGGTMITPTFGGKTEWAEFEVLTGNMMKFLPFGSMPYEQYIKKPLPSIVQEFKKNGYDTLAIHTYEKTFFNRYKAYPLLGFDRFIGVEDMRDPKYKGPFVSDDEFANQIITNLQDKTTNPKFLFAVSMENHFSYEGHKYDDFDIKVHFPPSLSEKSQQIIRNYAQGLSDADKALVKLTDFLKTQKEPTIVVYFGDHLGSMGDNYYTYKETGFLSSTNQDDWTPGDFMNMYSTPLVVWNNFGGKMDIPKTIGAQYLGNKILDNLGFQSKHPYFDFISQESKDCFIADSVKLLIDRSGSINAPLSKACAESERNHQILQYDTMFGAGFSSGLKK